MEVDWSAVDALAHDAAGPDGVIGIAVFDATGELFARHGERRFHSASTIKVPIMIEAYRQVEQGSLDLDSWYTLRDEDRIPGSGVLSHLHTGLELTVRDLVTLMIAISDNTATNLVLDRVGLAAVNATMQSLGMRDSILGRPMLGRLPSEGEPENWSTPRDLARCVQAIVAGEAANAQSCARMKETLAQQSESRRISRFLVEGAGISWGTKPGGLPGVHNDVGYVTSPRGTLSMAILCENLPDLDFAERTIGEIARLSLVTTGLL